MIIETSLSGINIGFNYDCQLNNYTSGCPWPSATLVHVLETFNF
jgi:hypothetical protein